MTRKNFYVGALALGALATITLAVTLTFSISTLHRRPTPPVNSPMVAQASRSTAAESKGGPKEGIKVHGHWTIEVRNPDGKLVTHREFENALQPGGAIALADFLGKQKNIGFWAINIGEGALGLGPCLSGVTPVVCKLLEPFNSNSDPTFFKTLTASVAFNTFVLNGTATAQRASQIDNLDTFVEECPLTFGQCGTQWFTHATLAAPVNGSCPANTPCAVNVVNGQIIQVKVVISFS